MDGKTFAAFLQARRKALGMKQTDLAKKLHVTDKAVSRWECALGFPDIKLLEPLAEALEVTVEELLQGRIRETPLPDDLLEIEISRLINEEKDLSWQRKVVFVLGLILMGAALFVMLQIIRSQIQKASIQKIAYAITGVGCFLGVRAYYFIVLRLYKRSKPWGIWHSHHTWIVFALGMSGAWIVGNALTFRTSAPVWNVLILFGGVALLIAAMVYYGLHEDEVNA